MNQKPVTWTGLWAVFKAQPWWGKTIVILCLLMLASSNVFIDGTVPHHQMRAFTAFISLAIYFGKTKFGV